MAFRDMFKKKIDTPSPEEQKEAERVEFEYVTHAYKQPLPGPPEDPGPGRFARLGTRIGEAIGTSKERGREYAGDVKSAAVEEAERIAIGVEERRYEKQQTKGEKELTEEVEEDYWISQATAMFGELPAGMEKEYAEKAKRATESEMKIRSEATTEAAAAGVATKWTPKYERTATGKDPVTGRVTYEWLPVPGTGLAKTPSEIRTDIRLRELDTARSARETAELEKKLAELKTEKLLRPLKKQAAVASVLAKPIAAVGEGVARGVTGGGRPLPRIGMPTTIPTTPSPAAPMSPIAPTGAKFAQLREITAPSTGIMRVGTYQAGVPHPAGGLGSLRIAPGLERLRQAGTSKDTLRAGGPYPQASKMQMLPKI